MRGRDSPSHGGLRLDCGNWRRVLEKPLCAVHLLVSIFSLPPPKPIPTCDPGTKTWSRRDPMSRRLVVYSTIPPPIAASWFGFDYATARPSPPGCGFRSFGRAEPISGDFLLPSVSFGRTLRMSWPGASLPLSEGRDPPPPPNPPPPPPQTPPLHHPQTPPPPPQPPPLGIVIERIQFCATSSSALAIFFEIFSNGDSITPKEESSTSPPNVLFRQFPT